MMTARRLKKRDNLLGWLMLRRKVDTTQLVMRMPDGNATALRLIENGQAMPTKDDLSVICEEVGCKATDIWDEEDLDLLGLLHRSGGRQHGDQTEFRCWMEQKDKRALEMAIKRLGFKTQASWFRQVTELTLRSAAKRAEKRGI